MVQGAAKLGEIAWASTAHAAVPPADGEAVSTVQLLAMGAQPSRNGKPPVVRVDDLAHAERIVAATARYHGRTDPVVDYDHQTFFGARPGVGGQAKASGWMRRIFATPGGVFAEVEWTPAAQSALAAREYRYISPAFQHDAQGRVLTIINAALTNTPSLDLCAVASATSTEGANMNLSAIAEALGLGAEATQVRRPRGHGTFATDLLAQPLSACGCFTLQKHPLPPRRAGSIQSGRGQSRFATVP